MEEQPLLPIDIEFGVFTPDVTGVATQKICADVEALTRMGI